MAAFSKLNDRAKANLQLHQLSTVISFEIKIVVFTGPKEEDYEKKYNIHRYATLKLKYY